MPPFTNTKVSRRQLISTLALLGAALAGCAEEDTSTEHGGDAEQVASQGAALTSGSQPGSPSAVAPPGSLFTYAHPWTTDVSGASPHPDSGRIIDWISRNGGWGTGVMRIDFSLTVLKATSSTPMRTFTPTKDFFTPDCDHVPFPIPPVGAVEGETGYKCRRNGDCHLLVIHEDANILYEMWRASLTPNKFSGGCAAVWDLDRQYPQNLRGTDCTSADAAGLPMTAMLFTPEEVQAGAIEHAIRFILPNSRIRRRMYVPPATHATGATRGGEHAPPYGVRFRLKPGKEADLPDGARVIARAMQKYGMFLSDGGNITLTAASDMFSSVKWADVGVEAYSLQSLQVEDFDVVDMGEPIFWTGDCVRSSPPPTP
jgi:hypothetical protein